MKSSLDSLCFLAGLFELTVSGGLWLGGRCSATGLEVAGVHWIVSVTTALSTAWLVSASAHRYQDIVSYVPPSCRPALGLQLEVSGRPCWGQAASICFAVWACSVWGSFILRAALYQQPDKGPRLGRDLDWLGIAAPGWAKEGETTPARQKDWSGEPRSCMWRHPAIPNHGAVPK